MQVFFSIYWNFIFIFIFTAALKTTQALKQNRHHALQYTEKHLRKILLAIFLT